MQNVSNKRKAPGQAKAKNQSGKRQAANPPSGQPALKKRKVGKQASAAAAYASPNVGASPSVKQGRDSVVVRHREFVTNVTGSVNYTVANTLPLNPGMAATFPWLSVIAQNYESYRFRSLKFEYKTRTGTSVPGSALLAIDPDSSDSAPATEQAMSTFSRMIEDAPWKDICLTADVAALHNIGPRKYVRTTVLAANQDIKLYDAGNMYVATVDGTAVAWGKLWVEYEVEFFTPQTVPAGLSSAATITNVAGTGTSGTCALGTSTTSNGALISAVSAVDSTVSLQNLVIGAEYQVVLRTSGAGTCSAFAGLVGLTLVTAGGTGGLNICSTYTATASIGAIKPVTSAATTNAFFSISQIPTSAL